jgi:hypothetical protein
MAIGVRILSDNLSGKTADVVFFPLSGGTINIGPQTVPFNYLDSYPYGNYELYFSEYDYSYNLLVPDTTPLVLTLGAEYTPGSIVAKYTLTSNIFPNEDINVTFDNALGLVGGGSVLITTGVTIPHGSKTGQTTVTLTGQTFSDWDGNSTFSNFSGAPSGTTIDFTNIVANQTVLVASKVTGSTSWHTAVLDFSGLTAQLIDLNVDDTYWTNLYDFYPTNEKGYMYVFSNNLDERLIIFTDAVGNETFRYTGGTYYPTYAIAGHSNAFIDPPDGVLVYGDGISTPTTFSWDPSEYEADINWDWDIAEKTGNFILQLRKLDDTLKKNYLMTSSGGILIDEYDPTSIIKYYGLYNDGDFIYEYAWNELEGKYESLKFYDGSNATILESIVFSGDQTYNNFYSRFYGNNQFVIVFYNGSDNNVDYLIYHYDGNTRTLTTQTHNRSNYQSITIQGETNFFPNEVGSDSVFILFYTQTGFDNRVGQEVSYLDIVYKLSGESWFYVSPYCGNNLFTICDNGDGNASVFSITQSGVIVDPLTAKTDVNYFGFDYFGDVAVIRLETITPNTFLFYYVNSQGQVSDSIVVDSSSWWNSDERYGNWWIFVNATNEGYYINESVTGFTSIPYYQNYDRGQNYYEKNNFKRPSDIVFFNDITFESQVLTRTTISSVFTLPAHNGFYSIEVGKSRFMYTYLDQTTGLLNINLYDFEYNLVNSISTEQTGWNSTNAVKDRYYVQVDDGTNFIYYLVSDSEIEFVTTLNDYDFRQINDYIWWD